MPTKVSGIEDGEEVCLVRGLSLRGIRARQFAHHEKGVARLNNGSFGSVPSAVQAAQAEWRARALEAPDEFINENLAGSLAESRAAIAEMISAPSVAEVMLLDNVTTAMNMLALDLAWRFIEGRFQKGDSVLLLNLGHPAVQTCFEAFVGRVGGRIIRAKIPFPISSPSKVLDCYRECLERMKTENSSSVIRLAVIDHITSLPTFLLPVKEMVALARSHGVEEVMVDGAHAFGSVEVDVQQIDADYYTGDLHNWFFTPPTVAFFHCKPRHLSRLHHPIVSTTHGKGLAAECAWVGMREYSAMLCVPAAISFVDKIGGIDVLRRFNHNRVVAMGEMLAREWGTCIGAPPEMVSSMIMVGLPPVLEIQSFEDGTVFQSVLRREFHVEVLVYCIPAGEQYEDDQAAQIPGITAYCRVSHQIYNKLEDYHCLRDAVRLLVRRHWNPSIGQANYGNDAQTSKLKKDPKERRSI